jgi:hypothetical protein
MPKRATAKTALVNTDNAERATTADPVQGRFAPYGAPTATELRDLARKLRTVDADSQAYIDKELLYGTDPLNTAADWNLHGPVKRWLSALVHEGTDSKLRRAITQIHDALNELITFPHPQSERAHLHANAVQRVHSLADELDRLAGPLTVPDGPNVQYVTLSQMATYLRKHKETVRRWSQAADFPEPIVPGGGGRAAEWNWADVRPVLKQRTGRTLLEYFPGA